MTEAERKRDMIIQIRLNEAFGFDNTPSTVDTMGDLRREYKKLKAKKVLNYKEHKRLMQLSDKLKSLENSMPSPNANEPVRPSWLGDDGLSPEKMTPAGLRQWLHYYPNDKLIAQRVAELDAWEKMQRLKDNDGVDPEDERRIRSIFDIKHNLED